MGKWAAEGQKQSVKEAIELVKKKLSFNIVANFSRNKSNTLGDNILMPEMI